MATYTRELSPEQQAAYKARWFDTVVTNPGFSKDQVTDAAAQLIEALLVLEDHEVQAITVARAVGVSDEFVLAAEATLRNNEVVASADPIRKPGRPKNIIGDKK